MSNISQKPGPADQAKTKAQLLAELNELRQRVAQWEAAAQPLNHSEERYRSVVTAMAEGVVMQQRNGEIVACNPAAEQILGLTEEQMVGRTSVDPRWRAIHEDGTPFPGETHPAIVTLQTGQPQRNVIMGVHKPDGTLTWILINSEPMFQPGASEPYAVVATFTDITAQRQIEIALWQSEQKFRQVIEQSNEGFLLYNETGRLAEWNPAAERIIGQKRAEVVGELIWDNLYRILPSERQTPAVYEQLKSQWLRYFQTGQHPSLNQTLEVEIQHPNGTRRMVQTARFSVETEQGYLLGSIVRDITELKQAEAALRRSEMVQRAVLEAIPDFMFWTDLQGHYIPFHEFNHVSSEVSNGAPVKKLNDALPQNVAAGILSRIPLAYETGEVQTFEYSLVLQDETRYYEAHLVNTLLDEILCTLRDITARKQAEAALRASEARFATVFRASPLSISITGVKNNQFIDVNEMWQTKTGFSREEALGRTPLELNLWPNPADREHLVRQLREHGAVHSLEMQIRVKSGKVEDVLMSAEVVEVAGEPCLLMLAQGLTERKQMEAALRASEAKFRQIIEKSGDGIVLIDQTGQIVEWNPAVEQIGELTRSEVLGRACWDIEFDQLPSERRTPAAYELIKTRTRSFLQTGPDGLLNGSSEREIQRPDGSYRDVQLGDFAVKTEPGFLIGSIIRDVTERKQMERIEAAQLAVSQVLAGSPEVAVALRQVLESVAAGLKWEVANLWQPDSSDSHIVWRDSWCASNLPELAEFDRVSRDYTFEPGEGLTGTVWQTGQAIWDQDLHLVKGAPAVRAVGLHSAVGIPIIRDEAVVGVMTFFSRSARPLDERLLAVLTDLGRQIGQFLARKETRAALQESQERLELVLGAAELGMWDSHFHSGEAVYNERWAEMLGYTLAELEPRINTWERLVHPDDLVRVNEEWQAHLDGNLPHIQTEHRMRTRSGEWKWILDIGKVVERDEQGQPVRAAGIHMDITPRKEAEETLRRYEHIVSTIPDWMALIDHNYRYQIVNQAYLALGPKTYAEIVGHTMPEVLGEGVFNGVIKPQLDQALAGETARYQDWFDFPAAGQRYVNVTNAPYRKKDGTVAGVMVSGRDITAAKLLEEHLQQVQKMGAIGQLAAGMAHHYNSMLTGIIGFTSLSLRALPPSDPVARNLERVLHTAERMAVLVRQLLAFAQKQLLQFKTSHLNELVMQLQDQLKQMVPAPIEFVFDLAPEVGQVKIDPRQFEYLLQALVSNARDAMPDGGRLTLTTTNVRLGEVEAGWYVLPPGDYVLLTVKDTGIGLTDEVKAHLFEPFFTTKDVGQGTGLGLAMSLGIAKQHGGHLLAESKPGQGATFMLYLPCLAPPAPPLPPTRSTAAGTILLVEAEPMVREFVAEVLSEQGYTVLKATNGEVALQRMTGQPEVSLQLLLTPIHSNSLALIEQLKTNSPGLRVIFLIDELEELPPERVDFLLKPFSPSSLMQKIRAVLEVAPE